MTHTHTHWKVNKGRRRYNWYCRWICLPKNMHQQMQRWVERYKEGDRTDQQSMLHPALKQEVKRGTQANQDQIVHSANMVHLVVWMCNADTITECRKNAQHTWEKSPKENYGPVLANRHWWNMHNNEIYNLYKEMELTKNIRLRRLQWVGYVLRMKGERASKKALKGYTEGRRLVGRLRRRWIDAVHRDAKSTLKYKK